jgi:hypothetical protein
MGKMDIAQYEAAIDKLCASCVSDIAKELKRCATTIEKRIGDLSKKIISVPIPASLDEKELESIPDRISKILSDDSTNLKDIAEPMLGYKIDVKKTKLTNTLNGFSGSIAEI